MKPPSVLAPFDEHAHEFIEGFDLIAKSARYGSDYFRMRYLDVPTSREVLSQEPRIESRHTGLGHYYLVHGAPVTHPSSASAWGQNVRDAVAEQKRDKVPGWLGSGTSTVVTGGVASSPVATTSIPDSVTTAQPDLAVGLPFLDQKSET